MSQIDIIDELSQNFIDFAYEANSARAFADARDGLKPGQRACLWEMFDKGYLSNKPHVKSAKISGGVIGAWWPHGDVAIYETFGRMSQPFLNNIPEVDWHGNNGNIVIGQALASDRYTEARLSKITEEGMFQGIKKKNVNMIPNFSEDAEWPEVLPAVLPRLLVNGCMGIGVTIANTWIPMNFKEVSDLIIEYLKTGVFDSDRPLIDFPSGGIITNTKELPTIHKTGRGKVVLRGTAEIKGNTILITELPYQVYVEPFIESIKKLIENEELTSIKDIYNKTDKKQLLIEIVCDNSPLKVLNSLYAKTELQSTYNANQWALIGKTPKLLTLHDYVDVYIKHNIECIVREYKFDLEKSLKRQEIVQGLLKALEDIDNVITLIKKSSSSSDAVMNLIKTYSLSEMQAKAIVDMKLGRLANLEQIELQKEANELNDSIKAINAILSSEEKQKGILIERLSSLTEKYGTPRKTLLKNIAPPSKEEKEIIDVEPEKCVVIMTEDGSVKRIPITSFKTQKRNGKGVKTQGDIVTASIRTNTIDNLMVFTNKGKMYRILVNDIPVGTNTSKGTHLKNLIVMEPDEEPTLIYSIYRDTDAKYIVFVTKNGIVKKTSLDEYINTKKKTGMTAINLKEGDSLISVNLIKDEELILLTSGGMGIKFNSAEVTATSRATAGIKGITLKDGDSVIAALPVRNKHDQIAIFSKNGMGKKIPLSDLALQKRAGKGLAVYKGDIAAGALVSNEDNILIIGMNNSICISAQDIPLLSRASTGNQLIKGSNITSVSKV